MKCLSMASSVVNVSTSKRVMTSGIPGYRYHESEMAQPSRNGKIPTMTAPRTRLISQDTWPLSRRGFRFSMFSWFLASKSRFWSRMSCLILVIFYVLLAVAFVLLTGSKRMYLLNHPGQLDEQPTRLKSTKIGIICIFLHKTSLFKCKNLYKVNCIMKIMEKLRLCRRDSLLNLRLPAPFDVLHYRPPCKRSVRDCIRQRLRPCQNGRYFVRNFSPLKIPPIPRNPAE